MDQLNGENFSNFVRKYFPAAFKKSANPKSILFLQDGDPTQNSRKTQKAFDDVGCRMFNNMHKKLREDVIEHHIEHESYEEFCNRLKTTLLIFSRDVIDSTTESLPKRMKLIMKGKGHRTKC